LLVATPSPTDDFQIVLEALIALLLFIPGTTLAASPLRDVTYRGELATRYACI
jgi:uncharacterized membrane protein YhaH (DUF805 family)